MMVTNAVLGGIADTVAQSITAIRERALRKKGGNLSPRDDPIAFELDQKDPFTGRELIPDSKILPPPFDFERLTRFMAYGFMMAPVQFRWFKFLEKAFPMSKTSAFVPAMKRVAFDQLIFAPFGVACFFTVMTVAEGGGRRAVYNKLRDMYVPTLKANYAVWPAVQIVNFRLMPVQFQLVSIVAVRTNQGTPALLTDIASHLSLLLVLLGQPTCLLRTPPRKRRTRPRRSPTLLTFDWSKRIHKHYLPDLFSPWGIVEQTARTGCWALFSALA